MHYCGVAEAMKLIYHPFDGDKKRSKEFVENVDKAFMFNARQGNAESIASWGSKINALQTDLGEAVRRVCKPEENIEAIGLINHLGKTCFVQGLHNESIQTIVRSRGETILLSQAKEFSLEEEFTILSMRERSPFSASGPTLKCNKCHKLGHTSARCLSSNRNPSASVREFLRCMREESGARAVGRDRPADYFDVQEVLSLTLEERDARAVGRDRPTISDFCHGGHVARF
ncbi:hypothetical protein B7P43_G12941 [Cryptotermes secundus]|uniref:Uncharacterized protein n=1 Tax=Cryptotermes secundus TaxID=105785 RepID=A0A2J7PCZ4_9NEOP|nr:hypothetical protein B7P43_G12941 [Cryptotermes secundus]